MATDQLATRSSAISALSPLPLSTATRYLALCQLLATKLHPPAKKIGTLTRQVAFLQTQLAHRNASLDTTAQWKTCRATKASLSRAPTSAKKRRATLQQLAMHRSLARRAPRWSMTRHAPRNAMLASRPAWQRCSATGRISFRRVSPVTLTLALCPVREMRRRCPARAYHRLPYSLAPSVRRSAMMATTHLCSRCPVLRVSSLPKTSPATAKVVELPDQFRTRKQCLARRACKSQADTGVL
mmetsp:Transcript_95385/g.165667  ORF Transcript_95385/g.165667 Transcript_95385/m.165667 type:complete len:241 (+) Transcript_95385:1208-1930(+)